MEPCQLELTQNELDCIVKCEAVIVREYQGLNSRFAKAVAWGDEIEMRDQASINSIVVVPTGLSIVCQKVVLVSDLLGIEKVDSD